MTDQSKSLNSLIVAAIELTLEIKEHPDHRNLMRGYKPQATIRDAYQAFAEISYGLCLTKE